MRSGFSIQFDPYEQASGASSNDGRIPLITRIANVKLKRVVLPGDLMEVEVKLKEILGQAAYMSGKVKVVGKTVLTVEFTAMLVTETA